MTYFLSKYDLDFLCLGFSKGLQDGELYNILKKLLDGQYSIFPSENEILCFKKLKILILFNLTEEIGDSRLTISIQNIKIILSNNVISFNKINEINNFFIIE